MKACHKILAVLAAAACGVSTAGAALIAADDFEDKTTDPLDTQGGGTGFTGTWSASSEASVVSSSLSYSNGAVTASGGGQALELSYGPGAGIQDGLFSRAFSPSQTGTTYLSILYREITNPAFGTDFIQVGFEDTGTSQPRASIMRRNGEYQVRAGTSSTPGGTEGASLTADFNTHLLVLKAEKVTNSNFNTVSIFFDPDSLTEPGTANAVANPGATTGIDTFGTLVGRSAFHAVGDTFQIDNIRIGTEWSDVVVPEPSTGALLTLLAGLGLLRRRRI